MFKRMMTMKIFIIITKHHYHLGHGFEVKDQKTVCKRNKKGIIKSKELRNGDAVSCLLCVLGQMKSETKMEASRVKFLVVNCCYDTGIEMSPDGS